MFSRNCNKKASTIVPYEAVISEPKNKVGTFATVPSFPYRAWTFPTQ